MGFQGWEIILVVAVVFLLFGASRLPQLAKSLGQSRKAFKEGMREAEQEFKMEEDERKSTPSALSGMSDEQLYDEARRRADARKEA